MKHKSNPKPNTVSLFMALCSHADCENQNWHCSFHTSHSTQSGSTVKTNWLMLQHTVNHWTLHEKKSKETIFSHTRIWRYFIL